MYTWSYEEFPPVNIKTTVMSIPHTLRPKKSFKTDRMVNNLKWAVACECS